MIRLEPLLKSDLTAIVEIEQKSFRTPWSRESFREVLEGDSFQTIGAKSEGKLVGYSVFAEVADEIHVLNVAVHPNFRRGGVAVKLLEYVHQIARKHGRLHAYLEVRESNVGAQALYKKFGYTPVGRRKDYYPGEREAAIVMVAKLAPLKKSELT